VPLDHPFFDKACELGQRTATNNVAKTPAKKHKRRRHHKRQDTPAPIAGPSSAPQFEDNGLPPADSLLFSPNPPTPASDAELFRPSPYQVAPTPSVWRTGNWGEPWISQPTPPLTPPIFDYGRNTIDDREAFLPDLDLDFEDNSWLQYVEDDLPGAVYHYDDDPLAPTAAAVALNQINRRVRDMGISG
jgi:hypothetical protein